MNKKLLVSIFAAVLIFISIIGFIVFDNKKKETEDLNNLKNLQIKINDPTIYSDSPIEEFNYIDQDAEKLHLEAIELSQSNQLDRAITLLNNAVNSYQGFLGYHYYEVKRTLSILYERQGYSDQAASLMTEIEVGQLELFSKEQEFLKQQ